MRYAPESAVLRSRIAEAALLLCGDEGFFFFGFDWSPHVQVRGASAASLAEGQANFYAQFLCWRAIFSVRVTSKSTFVTALDVSGDRAYCLRIAKTSKNIRWVDAKEDEVLSLYRLRR